MMKQTKEEISRRAEALAQQLRSAKLHVELIEGESVVGGGAAPSAVLPTRLLAVTCAGLSADELAARLRSPENSSHSPEHPLDIPIVARVEDGRVLLDLRTVFAEQDSLIAAALEHIAS
jgi:L-seryl-tRNA(Ser) seleniumtransferase